MDKIYTIFLVLLTIKFVKSTGITCEDSPTAQVCVLQLHSNNTMCDNDETFRNRCPCTCYYYRNATSDQNPDVNSNSSEDCQIDEIEIDRENQCEARHGADPSICDLPDILEYCPCVCRKRSQNPDVLESIAPEITNHHGLEDDRENVINPALCADIPDSKMEYDCQYRIFSNPKRCDDPSYRKMCRCTCTRFGNRATLEENAVQLLLPPDAVLPLAPDETDLSNDDPDRCPDYQDNNIARGCLFRVTNLKAQTCPDSYREVCPCTCRAQDEGELCPDSPWNSPLSGFCQMKADNGECSDPQVRKECPCTCAFVQVSESPVVESNATEAAEPHADGRHTGCIDTMSERWCNYFRTHNMCESQSHYCRQTCGKCSDEPIADGEEPVVNLMPDIDQTIEEETPTDDGSGEPCEDRAAPHVCEHYNATRLCETRWPFCKKTCNACDRHSGADMTSNETDIEIEIENKGDEEQQEGEEHEEKEENHEDEEEEEEEQEHEDQEAEQEGQQQERPEQHGSEQEQDEQPCIDSISSSLCENYHRTNQCRYWWRYCRQSCNVCDKNPYLETPDIPLVRPGGSPSGLNGMDRCPQCLLYQTMSMGNCNGIDPFIKDYCQTYCRMCLSDGELFLEGENKEGQEPDHNLDKGVLIDDEDTLNRDAMLPGMELLIFHSFLTDK